MRSIIAIDARMEASMIANITRPLISTMAKNTTEMEIL